MNIKAYGEEYIENGIPASVFEDGWSLKFNVFEATFSTLKTQGALLNGPFTTDLSKPSEQRGHLLGRMLFFAGSHTSTFSYNIDLLHIQGEARKGDQTLTWDWTLPISARYSGCSYSVEIAAKTAAELQITVHADHLFYDSAVAEEPSVRFQAFADADTNNDGQITQEELQDKGVGTYDVGNNDSVDTLWKWLLLQASTVGHINGEGHCSSNVSL